MEKFKKIAKYMLIFGGYFIVAVILAIQETVKGIIRGKWKVGLCGVLVIAGLVASFIYARKVFWILICCINAILLIVSTAGFIYAFPDMRYDEVQNASDLIEWAKKYG